MSVTDRGDQPPQFSKRLDSVATTTFHSRHLDLRDKTARSAARDHYKDLEGENEVALTLVSRAASTIEVLQTRCTQMELVVTDLRERLKSEAEGSERVIKEWESLAGAMKTQLHECESRIMELQAKLEAAEARAQAEEVRAEAAEHQAGMEEEIAASLRDKIILALGATAQVPPPPMAIAGPSDDHA